MGAAAVVANDQIVGQCLLHQVPSPSGAPMPAPGPLPFTAPLATGLATSVQINGRAAAVQDSGGLNQPPHPGLHASDPFLLPNAQQGRVVMGSATVRFEGKPAAYSGCPVTGCGNVPAQVTGSAATVQIGP
jgi:uncharacterized Zn-binding protein involved in type VI secretion